MVEGDGLASVLGEFARTMLTDFPIQGILDRLVERTAEVLPVSAAGITLISPGWGPHQIAASNEIGMQFEQLQSVLNEGPCVAAYESGEPVAVPDLTQDGDFAGFRAAAVEAGLAAVFAFPLRHGDGRLGALDLYSETAGPLSPEHMTAAQTLADVAAAYLLNAQARQDALEVSDRFRHSSLHDGLTGLPNRQLLQQRLEHAAQRARRTHQNAGVLFVDIDGFKQVNDAYGHSLGDHLLTSLAERLFSIVRPGDTLARVSGDEFVVLCEDMSKPADVERLASRIETAVRTPFLLRHPERGEVELHITASVGLAFAGRAEDINDRLIRDADVAMYQAKRKGGGTHQVVDLREAAQDSNRLGLQKDLVAAYADEKLSLAYQPIVRAFDGLVTGVEALLRWIHPERGPIATADMIAVAEDNGLIVSVGAWVLRRSCQDRMDWLKTYPSVPMNLAVNVSVRQLMGPALRDTVREALDSAAMDPTALTLEVTQDMFVDDEDRARTVLRDLKALGIGVALDDFGTGFSSLTYLREFPMDIVKIDHAFVAGTNRHAGSEIIGAVASFAHALGLTVSAEGVETADQRDVVADIGCEYAQGYFYAKPMSADELSALLATSADGRVHLPDVYANT